MDEFVRIVYKGRPIFHGTRDPRTGQELSGGWEMDDLNPWMIEWDSRKYDLFPGRDAFVPFPAMCSMFGDPRSSDRIVSIRDERGMVGFIPDRATEIRRLRTKYDNIFGDESVVEHHPIVEVYELSGTPITTVLDDPEGRTTIPVKQTQAEHGDLLEIVRRQQLTINKLMESVGMSPSEAAQTAPAAPEGSEGPPEDDTALVGSEAATGERGGRPKGEPGLDFSTLNVDA